MAHIFGLPKERLPVAIAMVLVLAFTLAWLQRRFDASDVRTGIALAMAHRPAAGGASIFEALAARGQGDPRCDGTVVSTLLGDVAVRCSLPARPDVQYRFRVLLDQKQPPRAANGEAERLMATIIARAPEASR